MAQERRGEIGKNGDGAKRRRGRAGILPPAFPYTLITKNINKKSDAALVEEAQQKTRMWEKNRVSPTKNNESMRTYKYIDRS